MVKTASVKLWGQRIGAVAWDENQEIAFFEYEKKFITGKLNVAPVRMPLAGQVYAFPELPTVMDEWKWPTIKWLPMQVLRWQQELCLLDGTRW